MEDAARKEAPHIVLYIGSLQKGGAERVMGNLAEYFYAQGMRVTLVTTYFHPPEYVLPRGVGPCDRGAAGERKRYPESLFGSPGGFTYGRKTA